MRSPVITAELEQVLATFEHVPAIVAGVRSALGSDPARSLDAEETPVVGFYTQADEALFRMFLVTLGRLAVFELTPAGEALTVCVPIERVSRVREHRRVVPGGDGTVVETLEVRLELDADRVTLTGSLTAPAGGADAAAAGGPEAGGLLGELRPAVYLLTAAGTEPVARLAEFARSARSALGF